MAYRISLVAGRLKAISEILHFVQNRPVPNVARGDKVPILSGRATGDKLI